MSMQALQSRALRDGREHLRAELSLLDLLIERHILRLRAAQLLNETDFRGLYIADEEVDALLRQAQRSEDSGAKQLTARIAALRTELCSCDAHAFPLGILQSRLALERFDIELLVVAAACEIDLRYQTLFAYAQNDVTRKWPSVDLALKLLCDDDDQRIDRRSSFDPDATLIRERLVRVAAGEPQDDVPLLAHRFRADTRVVDFLLGRSNVIDRRLAACTRRRPPETTLRDLQIDVAVRDRIARLLPHLADGPSIVIVEGMDGVGRTAVARGIAGQLGLSTLSFDAARLPAPLTADEAIALLRREALLSGDAIIVSGDEAVRGRAASELLLFPRPLFLITTGSATEFPSTAAESNAAAFILSLPLPSADQRKRLWADAVGDDTAGVETVAARFALTPAQIRGAAAHARGAAASRPAKQSELSAGDLHAGAHSQSSAGLRRLATRVEPRHDWSDLVLPPRPMQQLRDVCTSLEYRHKVHDEWGFGRRLSGVGTAVLFAGASGTGKSMAASIVARHLGLEMYRIDLAAVVSKYIGETEKNLDRIFAEAQSSNAVLFFDEADALFGKRSEVKDAHDRYANIEVAYLLQRIESYDGIVILATNLGRNIDEAFARRMFDTIEFPFPDAPFREQIWLRMLRSGAPLADDIDYQFLGRQFELSGGNIRNIVLAAAFAAAASSTPITMQSLILATARELQKIGRLPSRSEFREYYELLREDV